MEASARLFVGLALGPELGERALAPVQALLDPGAWRLGRAEGLHVTLAFLGDVERGLLPGLSAALARELAGAPAPRLVLDRAGAFPRPGAERVLWLGLREEPEGAGRLAELARRAAVAARAAGAAPREDAGRPFHPHVTVARPRRPPGRAPAAFHALAPELPFRPAEAALFESLAGGGAMVYAPRAVFPLAP